MTMIEQVNDKIDVLSLSRKGQGIVVPLRFSWKNKIYNIKKLGLTHPIREGRVLYHIFEGTDGNTFFRLKYDTENLQWLLESITDGLPS